MKARRQLRVALLGTVAALAAFTFAAQSAVATSSSNPVIADCLSHPGGLTGNYTAKQLTQALQVMPAEVKEYTNCSDVINRALLSAVGKGGHSGGTGGGSGSFLPTPVIVILVLLILAAVAFGAVAVRRRQAEAAGGVDGRPPRGGAGDPPPGAGAGDPPPGRGAGDPPPPPPGD